MESLVSNECHIMCEFARVGPFTLGKLAHAQRPRKEKEVEVVSECKERMTCRSEYVMSVTSKISFE